MTFTPENNRHYIAMVRPVYDTLQVPDLFRAKLGRIYETPDEQDTEAPAQELVPTVRNYLTAQKIPVREFENSVLFGIPMLSLAEVREGEALHEQLAQAGYLESGGVWLLTPQEAVNYVQERT
jgi:hypothetical protein